jgi:hypothetical protein
MRHSRFFLENACFVLLFDVVRDPTRHHYEKNFDLVAEGLRCFAQLPTDDTLRISTNGVIRLLNASRHYVVRMRSGIQDAADKHQQQQQLPTDARINSYMESAARPCVNGIVVPAPLQFDPSFEGSSMTAAYQPLIPSINMNYEDITTYYIGDGPDGVGMENAGDIFNTDISDMGFYLWANDLTSGSLD